jgi:formate transporter
MAFVKPDQVLKNMIQVGAQKSRLSIKDLLIRGGLSGALLGFATTLAFTAEIQSNMGILGAILFPAGFVIIILLGLELVTGNFALIPTAVLHKQTTIQKMLSNWFWVIIGHLIGCGLYALLFIMSETKLGQVSDSIMIEKLIAVSEAKTIGYASLGTEGLVVVFIKAMLCNWMVTLGAIMAMTAKSTIGKIVAMWLPIMTFFAQGFEHAVVNMFVIPAGMMLGANVSMFDWWYWNQFPVTIGNIVGGFLFTGLALYVTYNKQESNVMVKMSKTKIL